MPLHDSRRPERGAQDACVGQAARAAYSRAQGSSPEATAAPPSKRSKADVDDSHARRARAAELIQRFVAAARPRPSELAEVEATR